MYVQGLPPDGAPKAIEPPASHLPGPDVQALRQFVGQRPWAVNEVQRRLARQGVDLLSDPEVWITGGCICPRKASKAGGWTSAMYPSSVRIAARAASHCAGES